MPRHWTRYLYPAPLMIILTVLILFPILYAVRFSFYDFYLTRGNMRFVGLQNYAEALQDPIFRHAAWVNLRIIVASIIAEFALGLLLALACQSIPRGRAVVVALLTVPIMISTAATGMAFRMIMLPEYGPLNYIIGALTGQGWVPIDWYGDPRWALWSLVIASVWHAMPFVMLILLAGLVAINQELYEAARIDGAGFFRQVFAIRIPLLLPIMAVAVLYGIVFTFTDLIVVYILTRGGPFDSTQVLATWAYFKGIEGGSLGQGAAIALFLFPVLVGVAALMLRIAKRAETT